MSLAEGAIRKVDAHAWAREEHEHYVEPPWCSQRLFAVEKFEGGIWDPACGFGHIPESAKAAGHYPVRATDIVDRGYQSEPINFLESGDTYDNIAANPPFDIFEPFAMHALKVARRKVAMIWLVRRLNAARWLQETPLARVHLLTPRPSMPPGYTITAGQKPGGGTQDFAWLVWDKHYSGKPELCWLHRDASPTVGAPA